MVKKVVSGSALEEALAAINDNFGEGTLIRMGDNPSGKVEVIPTGVLPLDVALGIGGLPKGRIVEIYGPPMSGKTSLCLHLVAEAQKMGGICAYIDVEGAIDPLYAEAIGVDVDALLMSQPGTGEQALEIVDRLVRTDEVAVIIVDSVAALTPRAEIEGEMGDAHIGLHARLMAQALRKITAAPGMGTNSGTLLVFINQIRHAINVQYGSPEVTTGGRSLPFYASIRLDIRRREAIKNGEDVIGSSTEVKVVKNKCARPFQKCRFDILYGQGFTREGSILDLAVTAGIIERAGAWYNYNGEHLGQGREKTKQHLIDHPELCAEIERAIRGT